jgi:hypothetical protein
MATMAKGADRLRAVLAALGPRMLEEGGRALYQEALVEQKESMRRTPVDTGALRASHETERPVVERGQVSVRIVVGGPAAPYAVPVHERVEVHHPVGQAKFLESTIMESAPFMAERIAKRIDLNRIVRGAG